MSFLYCAVRTAVCIDIILILSAYTRHVIIVMKGTAIWTTYRLLHVLSGNGGSF